MPGQQRLAGVIEEAEAALAAAGVWAPREDAEVLAAHALSIPRTDLALDAMVTDEVAAGMARLVKRRAGREPLQYVTGREVFGGVELAVGAGVFVPRVESEPLLRWALHALVEVAAPVAVDLCTGSGALALAVAHARPDATVHAVELDPVALDWARRNAYSAARAGDTPILLHAGDVGDPTVLAELDGTADLVLCTPPYVPEGTPLPPEWSTHQPRQAIYAADDGFEVLTGAVRCAARLLRPGGALAVERGESHRDPLSALLRTGCGDTAATFTELNDFPDPDEFASFLTARRAG